MPTPGEQAEGISSLHLPKHNEKHRPRSVTHTHEQKSHFSGNHLMFFYKLFLVQLRQGLALCFMLCGCELFSVASRENLPFNSQGQGPGVSKHMLCSSAPEQRHGVPPSCIWRLKMTSDLCSTRGKQIEKQHNSSPAKNV